MSAIAPAMRVSPPPSASPSPISIRPSPPSAISRGGPSAGTRRACRGLESLAAAAFGVPVVELFAASRRAAPVALARQAAMYLAHVVFSLSLREVGLCFGRDPRTVAHACRRIEDRRDQPAFDALMARLEAACGVIAPAGGLS